MSRNYIKPSAEFEKTSICSELAEYGGWESEVVL